MAGALDDIRVLDATGPIGHYAGRLLADLGADVIKVEPPAGDAARHFAPYLPGVDAPENGLKFVLLNANKRGVTIDTATDEGRALFLRLVATADVLLDSLAPAERARLRLGDDALAGANRSLIHASITGWGLSGPHADWAYADIVACAVSGVMNLAGFVEGPPEQLPDQQGHICASVNAVAGVLAALIDRDSSGEGQRVEVSMQEALSMAQETAMQTADMLGTVRQRRGDGAITAVRIPGVGVYECTDGFVYLMAAGNAGSGFGGVLELIDSYGELGALAEEPLATFLSEAVVSGQAQLLVRDPSQAERAAEIAPLLEAVHQEIVRFARGHSKQELYESGQGRRVLIGMVSTPADISASRQLNARDWFVEIDDPGRGRTLRYPGPPWNMHGTPATLRRPAPLLGEHNAEVFGALGLEAAELARLHATEVV